MQYVPLQLAMLMVTTPLSVAGRPTAQSEPFHSARAPIFPPAPESIAPQLELFRLSAERAGSVTRTRAQSRLSATHRSMKLAASSVAIPCSRTVAPASPRTRSTGPTRSGIVALARC